jgi:hypothetical protein
MRKPWLRALIAIIALAMLGYFFYARDIFPLRSMVSTRDAPFSSAPASSKASNDPLADQPATGEQASYKIGSQSLASAPQSVANATNERSPSELGFSASQPDSNTPLDQGTVPIRCWSLRGSAPEDFVVGLDAHERTAGHSSATITSLRDSPGTGSLRQRAAAEGLRGNRVEFSVDLKTVGVNRAANVFFDARDANGKSVAFDNMWLNYDEDRTKELIINRGVKGDTAWSTQHVVLDIPKEAVAVSYGVFLDGPGKVWIDNARIEVVTDEMPTTAPAPLPEHLAYNGTITIDRESLRATPRNLSFESGAEVSCE